MSGTTTTTAQLIDAALQAQNDFDAAQKAANLASAKLAAARQTYGTSLSIHDLFWAAYDKAAIARARGAYAQRRAAGRYFVRQHHRRL